MRQPAQHWLRSPTSNSLSFRSLCAAVLVSVCTFAVPGCAALCSFMPVCDRVPSSLVYVSTYAVQEVLPSFKGGAAPIVHAPPSPCLWVTHVVQEEVLRLSRELALRTLQLEMEYAYRALEEEAMDIVGFDVNGEYLKEGCSGEAMYIVGFHVNRECVKEGCSGEAMDAPGFNVN
eukprot:766651-Pelagomonas_calceolata.AAC.2